MKTIFFILLFPLYTMSQKPITIGFVQKTVKSPEWMITDSTEYVKFNTFLCGDKPLIRYDTRRQTIFHTSNRNFEIIYRKMDIATFEIIANKSDVPMIVNKLFKQEISEKDLYDVNSIEFEYKKVKYLMLTHCEVFSGEVTGRTSIMISPK